MAKDFEDKFYDELKSDVVDETSTKMELETMSVEEKARILAELPIGEIKQVASSMSLEDQKKIYIACIAILESNVIKDPRALENLRKELAKANKEIEKKNAEKSVADGDLVGKEALEEKIEEREQKDDTQENSTDIENAVENKDEVLRQAYHDSIVAYYECRMKTLRHQIETGELLSSDKDHKEEEELELQMYKLRKQYMATGNEDLYEKFRENHDYLDRKAHEPFEKVIKTKATRYRAIEHEVEKIDKEISEINEELDTKELSQRDRSERTERIAELEAKRNKLDLEKAEYKDVEQITQKQRERANNSRELQKLRREAASEEQSQGYDYRRRQRQMSQHNVDVAQKTQYDNIKNRIEERERRIKKLEKKLEDTPGTDLKTRLNILEDLNKETNMLQADEDQQRNLDKGYVLTETEMQQETQKAAQIAEENKKEFEEDTKEVRAAIAQQDKVAGELAVEQPSVVGEEDREREVKIKAATAAALIDDPEPGKDNLVQDAKQYMVAKCVIEGVEKEVRDPNNPEDAIAMVEHDRQLKQGDKELDTVEKNIRQEM